MEAFPEIKRFVIYSLIFWCFALWGGPYFEPHGIVFGFAFMSLGLVFAHIAAMKKRIIRIGWFRSAVALTCAVIGYTTMVTMPLLSGYLFLTYLFLAWPVLEEPHV